MDIDDDLRSFLAQFSKLGELANTVQQAGAVTSLTDALSAHLGRSAEEVATVSKEVPGYRFADYDVAFELLAGPDATLIGIGGGDQRQHMSLGDMVGNQWNRLPVGQVDWADIAINATETRRVVALGIRLFRFHDQPVAVLTRRNSQMHGNGQGVIEVLSPDGQVASDLIAEATRVGIERSVLRGNVISLELVGYEGEGDGFRFIPRPDVPAEAVILPEGTLERVTGHVLGVAEHAEMLRRYGQHLKRGVLLYGPPGTGKTHTVRHLLSIGTGHTVILLSGQTLEFVRQATSIARHLQPAIVVLEDCDLVAMGRDFGPAGQPLLFELLDALDGLDTDTDIAFVLTTNRVDVLEEALTQRPGRVDLAVEIAPPDQEARRRLLDLYQGTVSFSEAALDEVARRSDAHTASFFKELIRRAVLYAAEDGLEPTDVHLLSALAALQSDQEALSRNLVGGFMDPFTEEL
ncbi:ATP-dependent 26S proteasome regulatory subunit [Tessaracoccus bendigoensis DSM 12906]|uniref:ATP-dependent 26S proteasome regulatory subunit n=1 Tax=Tessaracoccus bendigoensis DSM 12906 TaxID=1123357 RepID=A0A1M6IC01_9ACTN|nr:ATP-binding protein [Tessaracoccus bendigoensis]SHJ31984.1 ATP-dependent 26S proteasome regulatory subunit [Tessaracoccus bendigoensis DSM 12906]